ncbi:Retrovirus-related Pol polyprotein from transposon TNT 1-94 [Vitis vinifera]|uniref:Retrovirus-related Pol polyprotein from transposon TNT 1-94 n=1 Tax=Vitis vinifera TaxID=29760 RepID=A0A438GPN0_VITVI|nr:Retrovirus-related Pol polyprotein from transposon TNT 1-94 [Vitis vinifera]
MRITHVVIYLYVDDMLIFGTSLEVVCETKKFLGSKFDMKDLEREVILGIKITRTPNGLKLSQEHYVEKILRKFEHFDCKPVSTPYDPSSQLKKNREHSVAQIEYAQIIGSLMYLMNCTKPDIAYAVGRLSRYTQSPNQDHWTVRRVLKYLRGTINYGLCFSGFPSVLEGFSDANWISDSDEMKSTSGYVFILGGSAVSWKYPFMDEPTPSVSMLVIAKLQLLRLRGYIPRICEVELNLVDPLTKPLNKKLVEETSRGDGLMPITEVKSGDRVYSTLTKVECLLLMNTIFLMDGKGMAYLCQPVLYSS